MRPKVAELVGGEIRRYTLTAEQFGIEPASEADLSGGGPEQNAEIIRQIFAGESGPRREIAALNAGAAIYVAGRAESIADGLELARRTIDCGAAESTLEHFLRRSAELSAR